MRETIKIDSIPKLFSLITGIASLLLVIYGFCRESYWSALGLVLFVTSALFIMTLGRTDDLYHYPESRP